jgi:hypothetical protein
LRVLLGFDRFDWRHTFGRGRCRYRWLDPLHYRLAGNSGGPASQNE